MLALDGGQHRPLPLPYSPAEWQWGSSMILLPGGEGFWEVVQQYANDGVVTDTSTHTLPSPPCTPFAEEKKKGKATYA